MAEIHVRAKKHAAPGTMWIWLIVALLIIATVIYFVVKDSETVPNNTVAPPTTSQVQNANHLIL